MSTPRTPQQRVRKRAYERGRADQLRAQGICPKCAMRPLATTWKCRFCADKANDRARVGRDGTPVRKGRRPVTIGSLMRVSGG